MAVRKLKMFHLKKQLDDVLAVELSHYNIHEVATIVDQYTMSVEIEEDEHLHVYNRDGSKFTASLGDILFIDYNLNVIVMNKEAFNYLYNG